MRIFHFARIPAITLCAALLLAGVSSAEGNAPLKIRAMGLLKE